MLSVHVVRCSVACNGSVTGLQATKSPALITRYHKPRTDSHSSTATPFTQETNAIYDPVGTFTVPVGFLNPGRDFFRVVKP